MITVSPAPADSVEAPGYLLVAPGGRLSPEGDFAATWVRRGIWDTPEAAAEALERFVREGKVSDAPRVTSFLYPLFELMQREHGLTLIDSEMEEIREVCRELEERAKEQEDGRNPGRANAG